MSSLNFDVNYFDHFKTKRLIGILGKNAELLPIKLWAYCAKIHPETGRLDGYSVREIEFLMGWDGEQGKAVTALVLVGFLKEHFRSPGNDACAFSINDWFEYQGHLRAFKERSRKANRKRWNSYRQEHKDSNKDSLNGNKDSLLAPLTLLTIPTINNSAEAANLKSPTTTKNKERTPLQKVVCGWKIITGYESDDRDWDKAHWARTSRSAKTILDFFRGDWKRSIDCCQAIREKMEKGRLTCTIETVIKHMADWKVQHEKESSL